MCFVVFTAVWREAQSMFTYLCFHYQVNIWYDARETKIPQRNRQDKTWKQLINGQVLYGFLHTNLSNSVTLYEFENQKISVYSDSSESGDLSRSGDPKKEKIQNIWNNPNVFFCCYCCFFFFFPLINSYMSFMGELIETGSFISWMKINSFKN